MNLRDIRDCACPYCTALHRRHLSEGDVAALPKNGGRVEIICAECLGSGRGENPPEYTSWKLAHRIKA